MAIAIKQVGKTAALLDMASGGAISVSGTIEQYRMVLLTQATAAQAVTLPTPTDTGVLFALDVVNVGTVRVRVEGRMLPPGRAYRFAWDGASWGLVGEEVESWEFTTAGINTVAGHAYVVDGAHSINLPATPGDGDSVRFATPVEWTLRGATWVASGATTVGAGQTLPSGFDVAEFIYNATSDNWVVNLGGSAPVVDTMQFVNESANVSAWDSVVVIGETPLTANIVLTLPAAAGSAGKSIKCVRVDSTAFTVTLAANGANVLTLKSAGSELNSAAGSLTVEAVSSSRIKQVASVAPSIATNPLHWARWQLAFPAASTAFAVAPGTNMMPLLFAGNASAYGVVTDATNIVCAQSGRYRFDWLLMAPSSEFNDDGEVHIVVNGVSVASVPYDMNQASAVNQTTGTLTVDLALNDLVQFRYAGTPSTDTIVWGKGTYLHLQQIATESVVDPSLVPVNSLAWASLSNTAVGSSSDVPSLAGFVQLSAGTVTKRDPNNMVVSSGTGDYLLIPQTGRYLIDLSASPSAGQNLNLQVNGVLVATSVGSNPNETATLNYTANFAVGDKVQVASAVSVGRFSLSISQQPTATVVNPGTVPVQTLTYVMVTGAGSAILANNVSIKFPTVVPGGTIPYNPATGLFSLKGGKRYRLYTQILTGSTGGAQWTNSAGVALINQTQAQANTVNISTPNSILYTPASDMDVAVWPVGSISATGSHSWAMIEEVPTSTVVDPDSIPAMVGATSVAAGSTGWIGTAPTAGQQGRVWRGDATWAKQVNTQYVSAASYTATATDDVVVVGAASLSLTIPDAASRDGRPLTIVGDWSPSSSATLTLANFLDTLAYAPIGAMTLRSGQSVTLIPYTSGGFGVWAVEAPKAFLGAGPVSGGYAGGVPAPAGGDNVKFLRGDGTWAAAAGATVAPAVQRFTASGTYTPTAGMVYCIVEAVGAGGGSPVIPVNANNTTAAAASGGAGGSSVKARFTAAQIGVSQAVTVGAGVVGSAGGATSLGALLTAPGGGAGVAASCTGLGSSGAAVGGPPGVAGSVSSGSLIASATGSPGGVAFFSVTGSNNLSGAGGAGGAGGVGGGTAPNAAVNNAAPSAVAGVAGVANSGAGAAGGARTGTAGSVAALAGGSGWLSVTEYF